MGPRGLTASKAPRPFLDGEDFRAVEGERLVLGSPSPTAAPRQALYPQSLLCTKPGGPPAPLQPALHSSWQGRAGAGAGWGCRSPGALSCPLAEMGSQNSHSSPWKQQ